MKRIQNQHRGDVVLTKDVVLRGGADTEVPTDVWTKAKKAAAVKNMLDAGTLRELG